jgi:hypothetical protein
VQLLLQVCTQNLFVNSSSADAWRWLLALLRSLAGIVAQLCS